MSGVAVKTLSGKDGSRRIAILHANGLFRIEHQYHYCNVHDGQLIAEGWASLPGSISFYADAATAEREARSEYPWLA